MNRLSLLATLLAIGAVGSAASAAASLEILPSSIQLSGPQSRQQLLAEATVDGVRQDIVSRYQGTGKERPRTPPSDAPFPAPNI